MSVTPKLTKLPITYKGKPVVQAVFEKKNNKQFTRAQVKKIAQNYSNELKKKKFKGELSVTINFGGQLGPKAPKGAGTAPGEKIKLFKVQEYDAGENDVLQDPGHYNKFMIYIRKN
jgi:hypothetical protein